MRFTRTNPIMKLLAVILMVSTSLSIELIKSKYHWTDSGLLYLIPQVMQLAKDDFEVLILILWSDW